MSPPGATYGQTTEAPPHRAQAAFSALGVLAPSLDARSRAEALQPVLQAMSRARGCGSALCAAAAALVNLTSERYEAAPDYTSVVTALVAAMAACPELAQLQETACDCISNVAADDSGEDTAVQHGALEAVQNVRQSQIYIRLTLLITGCQPDHRLPELCMHMRRTPRWSPQAAVLCAPWLRPKPTSKISQGSKHLD